MRSFAKFLCDNKVRRWHAAFFRVWWTFSLLSTYVQGVSSAMPYKAGYVTVIRISS